MDTLGWLWLQTRRTQQGEHSAVAIAARLMDQRHPEHAQAWVPIHPVHPVHPVPPVHSVHSVQSTNGIASAKAAAGSAARLQVPTALPWDAAPVVDSGRDGAGGSTAREGSNVDGCRGSAAVTRGADADNATADAEDEEDEEDEEASEASAVIFPELSVELMRARMRGLQAAADESHARLTASGQERRPVDHGGGGCHSGDVSLSPIAGAIAISSAIPTNDPRSTMASHAALPSWAAPVEDLPEPPEQEDCARDLDLDCLRSASAEATCTTPRPITRTATPAATPAAPGHPLGGAPAPPAILTQPQ